MFPIDFFWRASLRWPDRIAIDTPNGSITYNELARKVKALAGGLIALDSKLQSRVAICAGNSAEHIIALLAILACGKSWVPLNPKSTRPEIRRIIDITEPSLIIYDEACADLLVDTPGIFIRTGIENEQPSSKTVSGLINRHDGAPPPSFELPLDAIQAIKFTGGTTGAPKGVMQPYRAWMANISNQIHSWGFDENERYIVAAPITHGTSTYIVPILAQGGCHVILDGAGAEVVRTAFKERAGTACFMPPTLLYMLMALPNASRKDYPKLRRLIYGGAPMPPEKVRAVREFFGPVLCTTYGQTEAPQILTAMQPEDFEDPNNWASVGRTTWFSDVAIMSPDGKLLPSGEIGEVVARGDLLMTGYWRMPEKTAETIQNGWLHTGDRGLIDHRGYLYLKDRLKDIVITGGFNVYPVDVENALSQHPAVHECLVFGIPDDKWGESVQAAVQIRPGHQLDEATLISFVRELLGPVQTPKRIHFYESLPRSNVGKLLKSAVLQNILNSPTHS
jgi:acyl-CoA synthetase (AMP-forming)/AMP-acid ligase II